jgi:deoxyadenosine/deoxycytidine kinase
MKILMLTGITGAGKSTLFSNLSKKVGDLAFSSEMFFSAYHCQNFFKETKFNSESLYAFYKSVFDFESIEYSKAIGALFENSFYNVCLEYNINSVDVSKIETLLQKHQCKQVVLMLPENKIYNRSIVTTRIHRKPAWSVYLDGFNMSDECLTTMFKEKQEKLLNLTHHSPCPTLTINTSEMNWDLYTEEIIKFWIE